MPDQSHVFATEDSFIKMAHVRVRKLTHACIHDQVRQLQINELHVLAEPMVEISIHNIAEIKCEKG